MKLLLNEEKFQPLRNHSAFPGKEGDQTGLRQALGGGSSLCFFEFTKASFRFATPDAQLVGEGVEKRPNLDQPDFFP